MNGNGKKRTGEHKSPDERWARIIQCAEKMDRGFRRAHGGSLTLRAAAYDAAKEYLALVRDDTEWLNEIIASKYGKTKESHARWIEETFEPLRILGEDGHRLIARIADGLKRRDYLTDPLALVLTKKEHRRRQAIRKKQTSIPAPPPKTMSLQARVTCLEAENAMLRRQVREDARIIAKLERAVDRLARLSRV